MRNMAVAGCLLIAGTLSSFVHAQSVTDQLIPATERAHSFGTVARAAKTEHQFVIRNPFKEPLHLTSIRASCGCTTPIIETEWIKPGETGTVLARFNTGTFTGDRKATLTLTIDRPQFMDLQLNVKGYIRSDIVFNPGELSFGNVPAGDGKQLDVSLDYAGKSDWKINKIAADSKYVSADFTEISRNGGRVKYGITARLSPECPTGPLATQLILYTSDQRLVTVPLQCFANVQADLSASPAALALGEIKPGQPIKQRILLKGNEPFNVLNVKGSNIQIEFEPTTEAKAVQFLNLTFAAPTEAQQGDNLAGLDIATDLSGGKAVRIELSYKLSAGSSSPASSGSSLITTTPVRNDDSYEPTPEPSFDYDAAEYQD
ncbi:MAG: DUF1573 domain-containing protein [Pirellulales bacterium]